MFYRTVFAHIRSAGFGVIEAKNNAINTKHIDAAFKTIAEVTVVAPGIYIDLRASKVPAIAPSGKIDGQS